MFKSNDRTVSNTFLVWIVGCAMSSFAYSMDAEEPITVNKARTSIRFPSANVRCFCNLPQCVSTGYMCKSSGGGCFSSFLERVDHHHSKDYRGRHGCVELLEDKTRCEVNAKQGTKLNNKKALTSCCYHDMCNHLDSPQTKDLINDTLLEDIQSNNENQNGFIGNLQQPVDYTNSQVWFRAATIAVPVCGAVILFVLIALAVKILRNENQNSVNHKLGSSPYMPSPSSQVCEKFERTYDIIRKPDKCLYHQYQSDESQKIQVPLLIQNEINTHHSGNKNETNAKLNLMQGEYVIDYKETKSVVLDIEKNTHTCSKSNLVNHVNNEKYVDVKFANDDKLFINSIRSVE